MPNTFTTTTFNTTYRDDFIDSDHYHRILFNSGRALQARELTQLQTITQAELERVGRHLFKEGSVVNPGGLTLDTNFEYVKLETGESTAGFAVGDEIVQSASPANNIKAKILRIEPADSVAGDPATLYVKYIDTQSTTVFSTPTRFTNGSTLSNNTNPGNTVTVRNASSTEDPHAGKGTRASINGGSYFTQGHFVSVTPQTILVSKYSNTPNEVIGMKVTEDIVTVDDTDALYDNQNNGIPNLTAPGADRYRITLTLAIESSLENDDSFFAINKIVNGELQEEVDETTYNILGREIATRIKEESGDYVVNGYTSNMQAGDSDKVLTLNVQPGIAYVDGYRASIRTPTKITVNKPRDTEVVEETIAANYGNYVIVSADPGQGFIPNIDTFETVNLRSAANYSGSTIGSARVRSMTTDGSNYRLYLFDVQMTGSNKFSATRSIGLGNNEYFDLVLEGGVAVIKEAVNNNLFFDLGKIRPSFIDDVTLTVQRKFTETTLGDGTVDLGALPSGESFSNQTQWIIAETDGDILENASASGSVISGATASTSIEVIAYVDKTASAVTIRPKTLNTVSSETTTVESDGAGFKFAQLANPDIVSLTSVVDANSVSVANRFTLDNGQRDNFYYDGRLILNGGQTAPSGNLTVAYTHYAHGAGDFFAVNSYPTYDTIPKFRQRNGVEVDLRDVLDFRPYKADDAASYSTSDINELPQNTDTITADVTYYKRRNDILTITADGELDYIEGVQVLDNPITPQTPNDAMKLKEFQLQPYTDDQNDLTQKFIQNRRFTMRDISDIVERIDNLEEITTLNLLEAQTAAIEVLDSSGNNRFKNGFFADNFKDLAFSNVSDANQYTATIDLNAQNILPDAVFKSIPLAFDSASGQAGFSSSANVKLSQDFVTLDYSEDPYIVQNVASGTENINPFEVITFVGSLKLEPEFDEWQETRTITRVITRTRPWGRDGIVESTTTVTSNLVSVELLPTIRSRLVRFKAEALKPLTRHFLFFDGEEIASYAREETLFTPFARRLQDQYINSTATSHPGGSSNLISDANGEIIGSFLVPNNSSLSFDAGEREVKLLDISANNDGLSTSGAFASYFAQGFRNTIVRTIENTIVLPRPLPAPRPRDPLAQSFIIQNAQGAFLTSIDVYFNTAPAVGTADANIPVRMELRPLRNGVPSQTEIVPGSEVIVPAATIRNNIPSDLDDLATIQATPTKFTFDAPVYIPGNTPHAFILMADTVDYNVYVAKAGGFIIGKTDQRIRKQPSLGSLFMSQNSITWTPDQTRDMMFQIHRASFVSSGTAILQNIDVPHSVMGTDPFLTDSGSTTVTVNYRGHGLGVNDKVTIFGIDSNGDFGGIKGTSLQGERIVTAIDGTGFRFTADSAATSTIPAGGSGLSFTDNIQIDNMLPQIDTFIPASPASLTFSGTFAKGRSIVPQSGQGTNAQNTFAISSAIDFNPLQVITFDHPQVVAHRDLEDSSGVLLAAGTPRRSVQITASLATNSNFVSPVINMSRASLGAANNLIDNQDPSSGTNPLNLPLNYVAETDPANGSHLSKHITVPINLEQPAVGLKVLIGANRPNGSNFDLYYRTIPAGADTNIEDISYSLAAQDTIVQTDENPDIFREYEYTIGGLGGTLTPFTTFQLKIVMRSSNSSKIPTFRDLRAIALGT